MKYLKLFESFLDIEQKVNDIVDSILQSVSGGEKFFDMLDDEIKDLKNIDITIALFEKIYEKYKYDYNLVLSGEFGNIVFLLWKRDIIKCSGTILILTGSITSHQNKMGIVSSNKEVNINFQFGSSDNLEFVFVDDSYYSGTTCKLIDRFLSKRGSSIKDIYVIYDGNDSKDINRHSLYSYYDKHSGRNLTKNELMNKLNKIDGANTKEISELIDSGEIKTNRDLINAINYYWKKDGVDKYIDPRNFNFANQF